MQVFYLQNKQCPLTFSNYNCQLISIFNRYDTVHLFCLHSIISEFYYFLFFVCLLYHNNIYVLLLVSLEFRTSKITGFETSKQVTESDLIDNFHLFLKTAYTSLQVFCLLLHISYFVHALLNTRDHN